MEGVWVEVGVASDGICADEAGACAHCVVAGGVLDLEFAGGGKME